MMRPDVAVELSEYQICDCEREKRDDLRDLCRAALSGDWKTTKHYIIKDRSLLHARLAKSWDTLIHLAVHSKHIPFVKELVDYLTVDELAIENRNKDTGQSIAAISGIFEVAELMVNKNSKLTMLRGTRELIPFGMAAEAGHKKMAEFLYLNTQFGCLDRGERIRLFFITLTCDLYDFKGFCKQGSKLESAHELLAMIWKKVLKQSDEEISDLIRRPSGVLFDAAMSGNVEFLALLLRNYPDLLWEVNEKGQTIFHVAVLHRHVEVFNLIKNIGAAKEYIVGYIDADKNNMLHLAGMLPQVERLGAPRANLQMQRELLWFKEVKKIVRPFHKNMRNYKGLTPEEVFDKEHKYLLKVGQEATRETANSCMLVATLISTVVFAAALIVPGASNKISNTPFFNKDQWFKIFILSNAVALFTSATSIVFSLSILTSSYAQSEFVYSLHARLMSGLITLFISLTTMVSAFIAAIFLIFDYKGEWVQYVIAVVACCPVILFLKLYYNLLADLIRSICWSWSLFRRSKHQIF